MHPYTQIISCIRLPSETNTNTHTHVEWWGRKTWKSGEKKTGKNMEKTEKKKINKKVIHYISWVHNMYMCTKWGLKWSQTDRLREFICSDVQLTSIKCAYRKYNIFSSDTCFSPLFDQKRQLRYLCGVWRNCSIYAPTLTTSIRSELKKNK